VYLLTSKKTFTHNKKQEIMHLLRSIKSAQALGLAVITTGIMIAANAAPMMAQAVSNLPAVGNRTITFFNQGGYNARYFITAPGMKTFDSQTMLLGQRKSATVPAFTHVTVTGRMEHNRQVVFQRTFRLDNSACFKTFGTIFNPSANTSCQ
jgi:hypothetical protein